MSEAGRGRGRPPVSSREEVEAVAIGLFLEHGYAATSLAAITAASGVSRTTFFRYFPSKSWIIWSAFEEHTGRLRRLLADAGTGTAERAAEPVMTVVRTCVVESLRASVDDRGIWMKRFVILDESLELRAEESAQWIGWAEAVAEYVAARLDAGKDDLVPASVGGAVQAAFLATLRGWKTSPAPAPELLRGLDEALATLCEVLQGWIDREGEEGKDREGKGRGSGPASPA
ncbi:acyl-CoA-like ligand-binding transcription factor [Streptomyces corynorhini]|uniref:TetR family transcriptional regulator n=1 Tax=Streptomyces corynorhini TaxID=2282652 RepID=A0A370B727_9ACTN|nr:TetR family transcriptional regulator [Streptomyces corynorhini]RDG37401.1 TetR family transcriptional regulator [Streptomyces corynorhini]